MKNLIRKLVARYRDWRDPGGYHRASAFWEGTSDDEADWITQREMFALRGTSKS